MKMANSRMHGAGCTGSSCFNVSIIDNILRTIELGEPNNNDEMIQQFDSYRDETTGTITPEILNLTGSDGDNLLTTAVRYNNVDMVNFLVNEGVDLDVPDSEGHTSLMLASMYSRVPIVSLLLEKGADPNIKGRYGLTALMWATKEADEESAKSIVTQLLENGADVNIQNNNGFTVLIRAAIDNKLEVVKILLDSSPGFNVDVDIKDNDGRTALNWAVRRLNTFSSLYNVIKLLIEHEADVNTVDTIDELTLLDQAIRNREYRTAMLLFKNNAKMSDRIDIISTSLRFFFPHSNQLPPLHEVILEYVNDIKGNLGTDLEFANYMRDLGNKRYYNSNNGNNNISEEERRYKGLYLSHEYDFGDPEYILQEGEETFMEVVDNINETILGNPDDEENGFLQGIMNRDYFDFSSQQTPDPKQHLVKEILNGINEISETLTNMRNIFYNSRGVHEARLSVKEGAKQAGIVDSLHDKALTIVEQQLNLPSRPTRHSSGGRSSRRKNKISSKSSGKTKKRGRKGKRGNKYKKPKPKTKTKTKTKIGSKTTLKTKTKSRPRPRPNK